MLIRSESNGSKRKRLMPIGEYRRLVNTPFAKM
jgi:hypothetical protein